MRLAGVPSLDLGSPAPSSLPAGSSRPEGSSLPGGSSLAAGAWAPSLPPAPSVQESSPPGVSRRPARSPRPARSAPSAARLALRAVASVYLLAFVAVPVAALLTEGLRAGLAGFAHSLFDRTTLSALALTLEVAVVMAAINAVMGTWIAYVLVRYRFPGRTLLNALIDLPFAIPTLVTGVMLVVLFGPSSLVGRWAIGHGVPLMFAPAGIVIALLFVTLPFVVRAVQPVLLEIDASHEEAAMTLGASKWVAFWRVVLPPLVPAIAGGTLLSFARALGEFGSIVIVSGNIPRRTLVASVLIYGEIESGRPEVAAAISTVLLAIAFTLILAVDAVQRRRRLRHGLA